MTDLDELKGMANELASMKGRFVEGNGEWFLRTDDQARFSALEAEARSILEDTLGPANQFTMNIIYAVGNGTGGFQGGPSLACVTEVEAHLHSAIRTIERKARAAPLEAARAATRPPYVNSERIYRLQMLQSESFDFSKLIKLCSELNIAHEHECHHAVAMLVRSIIDHVPPVFGHKTFIEVVSNYGGAGSSFKKSMEHLQKALRNIADAHLHSPIRQRESLPTDTQVDFRAALDQLLAETIRIA
ncbi:hypothetical protein [Methylobacterium nigriterrae]|uniref:hypothetical protein n=1 Tax=Methylobacterium nigriterrae TaxID=3127512 RepID=UPI0030136414